MVRAEYSRMLEVATMEIDSGEYRMRPWQGGDEESLAKYANIRNVWINLRDSFPHPHTVEDAISWVQLQKDKQPTQIFAIATADEAIRGIGIKLQGDVHRCAAEIGYFLGEPFWALGIATRALRALTEYAFANFDLVRLYATVFEWNPASARVLEKAGFTFEVRMKKSVIKDGQVIDEFLYALVQG